MEDAQDQCFAVGGILPEPKNSRDHDYLISLTTEPFYLGTTDMTFQGSWLWNSDLSQVHWARWRDGEPDNGSNQDCVIILRSQDSMNSDRWASANCRGANVQKTVCEKKGKFKNIIPPPPKKKKIHIYIHVHTGE